MIFPVSTRAKILAGVFAGIILLGVGASLGLAAVYDRTYTDRFFSGIRVFHTDLGGLTPDEAQEQLLAAIQQHGLQHFEFLLNGQTLSLEDPDHKLVQYHLQESLAQAIQIGRGGSWFGNNLTRLRLRSQPKTFTVAATVDTVTLHQYLEEQTSPLLTAPKDAALHIMMSATGTEPERQIDAEQEGMIADLDATIRLFQQQAATLDFQPIVIPVIRVAPEKTVALIEPLLADLTGWFNRKPIKLTVETKTIALDNKLIAEWLNVVSSTEGLVLGLDPDRVRATLETFLGKTVVLPKKDGLLVVDENNQLVTLETPQEGVQVNGYKTIQKLDEGWQAGSSTVPIVLDHLMPVMRGADAERLGVQDILGVGTSNFAGSPTNRRKNIALGAKKVNGSLIAPDATFSLLTTLGEIDEASGWFKELVIKQNKTEPEYGGGLCQIGTTAFRAALASGMPITQRANHSYRVPYYEPAGTDATIYDPAPDFRFKNDTGHWILITTLIKGDNVFFTFWGTDDERQILQTKARVYNIVPPPPKKIIETLDLPPGKTKCTERPHAGADASFDYTVTYPNGETKKVTFNSHYKPWGEVCLLGVTELTASTTIIIDESGVNNPN